MYFPDLAECRYHSGPYDADRWQARLLAIGWLEHPHNYSRGTAPEGLIEQLRALVELAETAHRQFNFRGLHDCSRCAAQCGGTSTLEKSHINMFIPGDGVVYAAPAGIVHHIEFHSYVPPSEFVTAAFMCPTYGSETFFAALRAANRGVEPPVPSWEEWLRTSREAMAKAMEARLLRDG